MNFKILSILIRSTYSKPSSPYFWEDDDTGMKTFYRYRREVNSRLLRTILENVNNLNAKVGPARIALLSYADGEKRYILQPVGLQVGAKIISGPDADILVGNALPLKNIPAGTIVHNIELKPGKGAQMARSAGAQAQLVAKEGEYALLKLPSGETRKVLVDCMATVGQVGNTDHENISLGKAGRNRWLGVKPTNRGVVMNPVDHPHGGGEGKTSGGRHPVTPWGQPTRGYKTRNNKRTDKFIVSRRGK